MHKTSKEIASVDSGRLIHAGERQSGGWFRRLQPERPVRAVGIVVLDVDPQDLLEVAAIEDEQPVQALSPYRANPALRIGIGVRRLYRRDQNLGALGAHTSSKLRGNFASWSAARSAAVVLVRRAPREGIRAAWCGVVNRAVLLHSSL
jgi:hypothetical protein